MPTFDQLDSFSNFYFAHDEPCFIAPWEDAGNEAPGRICNKHGGHEDANEEIGVLFAHRALHLGKILCPNDHCVVIRTFPLENGIIYHFSW